MKYTLRKILSLILVIAMLLLTAASFTGSSAPITADDSDGDGWDEDREFNETTDPEDPDTDGDGIIDSKDDDPLKKAKKIEQYDKDEWDREEVENSSLNIFLFVLLLSFAVFSLLAGIFTAYFGAGKSRAIGGGLLVFGLIVILIWFYFGVMGDYPDDSLLGIVHWEAAKTLEAFVTVIGAVIGAVIAIVLFLVAIMKS